jgi:phosphoglycolate phosphatase-like HAD superfamily hydrolase
MPKAAIFDLDGTLLDSVDLHALAWHEALAKFGHDVTFEQARSQIGKGGDKLIPVFLSADEAAGLRQGNGGVARRAFQDGVPATGASVLRCPRSVSMRAGCRRPDRHCWR